jgi:hypothetical protein
MATALTHVKQFISAGFDMAQWGVRRNAIPYGPTGTIAQNNSAELSRIFTVKTADVSVPEADVVPITGDDGLRGSFLFASNQPISFTMGVRLATCLQIAGHKHLRGRAVLGTECAGAGQSDV